jgi:hypothetical protein
MRQFSNFKTLKLLTEIKFAYRDQLRTKLKMQEISLWITQARFMPITYSRDRKQFFLVYKNSRLSRLGHCALWRTRMLLTISDTSVLIDIECSGLASAVFSLPWQFAVPDILFTEELAAKR